MKDYTDMYPIVTKLHQSAHAANDIEVHIFESGEFKYISHTYDVEAPTLDELTAKIDAINLREQDKSDWDTMLESIAEIRHTDPVILIVGTGILLTTVTLTITVLNHFFGV